MRRSHRLAVLGGLVMALATPAVATGQSAATRPDGSFVVSNEGLLAAFEADGSIDTAFGPDGAVREVPTGDVAVLPDGRPRVIFDRVTSCVGVFNVYCEFGTFVERFEADGGLEGRTALAQQEEPGRIDLALAVAGDRLFALDGLSFDRSLVRLGPDGEQLDYANSGAIGLEPMGTGLLTLGYTSVGRYDAQLDPVASFGGGDGRAELPFTVSAAAPDGERVVVAGTTDEGAHVVARLLPDGELDPDFGTGGTAVLPSGDVATDLVRVAAQPGGGVLVGGFTRGDIAVPVDFRVFRLDDDGEPDADYGAGGSAVVDFGGGDSLDDLLLADGGEAIVTGRSRVDGRERIALARLTADGELDEGFGDGGRALPEFDTTDPAIVVDEEPPVGQHLDGASLRFEFSSPEEDVTLRCLLLQAALSCDEPLILRELPHGRHRLVVEATDSLGNVGRLDRWLHIRPVTRIVSGPPPETTERTASFRWLSVTQGSEGQFQCRLDGGAWEPCGDMPYGTPELPAGEHTFEIEQAVWFQGPYSGNGLIREGVPVRWTWTVAEKDEPGTPPVGATPPGPGPAPPVTGPPVIASPPVVTAPTLAQRRAAARAGLRIRGSRARLRRSRAVSVSVASAVAANVRVTGSLRMAGFRRAIAVRAFDGRVAAGGKITARLRLSRRARAVLRRSGGPSRVTARLEVVLREPGGARLVTRSVTLRPRR